MDQPGTAAKLTGRTYQTDQTRPLPYAGQANDEVSMDRSDRSSQTDDEKRLEQLKSLERRSFHGTFPEDVFDEDEHGRRIVTEQYYCPSWRMTLIVVGVLLLIYFIFFKG